MMSVATVLLSATKVDAAYCGLANYQHGASKVVYRKLFESSQEL